MLVVAVSVFAYPWSMHSRLSRLAAHLPLLFAALWLSYEWMMPAGMNIRVDLLVLLPLAGLVAICYLARLILLIRARGRGPMTKPVGRESAEDGAPFPNRSVRSGAAPGGIRPGPHLSSTKEKP